MEFDFGFIFRLSSWRTFFLTEKRLTGGRCQVDYLNLQIVDFAVVFILQVCFLTNNTCYIFAFVRRGAENGSVFNTERNPWVCMCQPFHRVLPGDLGQGTKPRHKHTHQDTATVANTGRAWEQPDTSRPTTQLVHCLPFCIHDHFRVMSMHINSLKLYSYNYVCNG